jgi:predicted Zn-dependent peptidase
MTEEILQAAILKLRSKALEQYGIIKDIYHRPAVSDSVDRIAQHALNLAQIEGAIITLQQYSEGLAKQTEAEEISNTPEEPPQVTDEQSEPEAIAGEELLKRSPTARKQARANKIKKQSKKEKE